MTKNDVQSAITSLKLEMEKRGTEIRQSKVLLSHNSQFWPGFYVHVLDFVLFILQYIRDNRFDESGNRKNVRWFDWILDKSFRSFVLEVISRAFLLVQHLVKK